MELQLPPLVRATVYDRNCTECSPTSAAQPRLRCEHVLAEITLQQSHVSPKIEEHLELKLYLIPVFHAIVSRVQRVCTVKG